MAQSSLSFPTSSPTACFAYSFFLQNAPSSHTSICLHRQDPTSSLSRASCLSLANTAFYNSVNVFELVVQFSCSVVSNSLQPHELQHTRPLCPITNCWSSPKPMSIESAMPYRHLILCQSQQFCRILLVCASMMSLSGFDIGVTLA